MNEVKMKSLSENRSSDEENNIALSLLSPAFFMDEYLTSFHILFAVIGIPLNLLLAGFIIFLERLQSPRNFIWIGIGFSNIFILIGRVTLGLFGHKSAPFSAQSTRKSSLLILAQEKRYQQVDCNHPDCMFYTLFPDI